MSGAKTASENWRHLLMFDAFKNPIPGHKPDRNTHIRLLEDTRRNAHIYPSEAEWTNKLRCIHSKNAIRKGENTHEK